MVHRRLLHRRADRKRDRRARGARVAGKNGAASQNSRSSEAHADALPAAETQAAVRKNAPCASGRQTRPPAVTLIPRPDSAFEQCSIVLFQQPIRSDWQPFIENPTVNVRCLIACGM
jgi:hypothetical protein